MNTKASAYEWLAYPIRQDESFTVGEIWFHPDILRDKKGIVQPKRLSPAVYEKNREALEAAVEEGVITLEKTVVGKGGDPALAAALSGKKKELPKDEVCEKNLAAKWDVFQKFISAYSNNPDALERLHGMCKPEWKLKRDKIEAMMLLASRGVVA